MNVKTFDEWWEHRPPFGLNRPGQYGVAKTGWDARQPEVDVLRDALKRIAVKSSCGCDPNWPDRKCDGCIAREVLDNG